MKNWSKTPNFDKSLQKHTPKHYGPLSVHHTVWNEAESESRPYSRLAGHETSTHICLKMEHLIYMFKALSIQAAAKVNTRAALVFPKRFSGTLNILTKLSN